VGIDPEQIKCGGQNIFRRHRRLFDIARMGIRAAHQIATSRREDAARLATTGGAEASFIRRCELAYARGGDAAVDGIVKWLILGNDSDKQERKQWKQAASLSKVDWKMTKKIDRLETKALSLDEKLNRLEAKRGVSDSDERRSVLRTQAASMRSDAEAKRIELTTRVG